MRRGITEPAHLGDERTTLLGFLQRHLDLVAWKASVAPDDTLSTARTPSGLTLHGIVRHLTNVERSWFREAFAGETGLDFDWSDEDPDGEFRAVGVPMSELLADYAAEARRCDEVIRSAAGLDATAADPTGKHTFSLRWVITHMIEETGRHLGHMDILRERADGAVGEDPTST